MKKTTPIETFRNAPSFETAQAREHLKEAQHIIQTFMMLANMSAEFSDWPELQQAVQDASVLIDKIDPFVDRN